jgi:predicted transcriptional regulator
MPKNDQTPMSRAKVRITVDLSRDLNRTLDQLAEDRDMTKSELLRRAVMLLAAVSKGRDRGQELALIDREHPDKREVIII